ncbi:MAG: 16S rRNA (adenine(1518)-N(6)/adenine(1519)-N(6))-dimethyltransferase RsmA [Bacteroidales bacterium]|nr:16S rRNA (adenine(1518)-N(6)/adenine(1519)-N(6))-dimethyltransferase RsmA [Bacteroidales bacterium]
MDVKPKKNLGQHFLTDLNIAKRIADSIDYTQQEESKPVCLEIGPGMGVLTQFLLNRNDIDLSVIEIDRESVEYLVTHFPQLYQQEKIIGGDFLKANLNELLPKGFPIICGNFPYNISSQIFFKILDHKDEVRQVVCMLQREVAERIANKPGTKEYGILSVFLQAYYDIEYLFGVDRSKFNPPPKVQSAVIRLKRNGRQSLPCDEALFRRIVKESFGMRRKMIRNSLSQHLNGSAAQERFLTLRPEQLSVDDFVELTNSIS